MAETHVGAHPNGNVSRLTFRLTMVIGLMCTIGAGGFFFGVFWDKSENSRLVVLENTKGRANMQTEVNVLLRLAAAHAETHKAVERRFDTIDKTLRRIEGKMRSQPAPR
jgi:hypothetical protein